MARAGRELAATTVKPFRPLHIVVDRRPGSVAFRISTDREPVAEQPAFDLPLSRNINGALLPLFRSNLRKSDGSACRVGAKQQLALMRPIPKEKKRKCELSRA